MPKPIRYKPYRESNRTHVVTSANQFTKTQTWSHGADVASASDLVLGDGNIFNVTGTATIASIASKGKGTLAVLKFATTLTMTHHATNLILPNGVDFRALAGSILCLEEYDTGKWQAFFQNQRSGTLIGVRTLTSGTSYTPSAGVNSILVKVIGPGGAGNAGGSGSGGNGSGGGGGGGGGYAEKLLQLSSSASIPYAIGSGGTAEGGNGSTTTFGSPTILSATGGKGGSNGTAIDDLENPGGKGGVGGFGSGGDINLVGTGGTSGYTSSANGASGGTGGMSGGGYGGSGAAGTGVGPDGTGYGGGGCGGGTLGQGSASGGGDGAQGAIIVYEYS